MTEWYRSYVLHVRSNPAGIKANELIIARLMDEQQLSRNDALVSIWIAGRKAKGKEIEAGNPDRSKLEKLEEIDEFYRLVKLKARRRREFKELYEELGPEKMQELAEKTDTDFDEFLEEYRLPRPSRSQRLRMWIREQLSDGEPHPIGALRVRAIQEGLLTDPKEDEESFEKDYQLFRTTASRLGAASGGKRGFWQIL